ncbi:MAG: hypothetical protein R2788_23390 [Saprospiraceae bacterium]
MTLLAGTAYRQIESNLGSDDFGEVVAEQAGTQHQYVRNFLDARVTNTEIKGGLEIQKGKEENGDPGLPKAISCNGVPSTSGRKSTTVSMNGNGSISSGYSLPYDTVQLLLVQRFENNQHVDFQPFQCLFAKHPHVAADSVRGNESLFWCAGQLLGFETKKKRRSPPCAVFIQTA